MKAWALNGNGLSFLTAAEQSRVIAGGLGLRFRAEAGFVDGDGESHLYCGDRIIATWGDKPEPTVVPDGTAPQGDEANVRAQVDGHRRQLAEMRDSVREARAAAETANLNAAHAMDEVRAMRAELAEYRGRFGVPALDSAPTGKAS